MSTTFRQVHLPAPRAEAASRGTASRTVQPPVWCVEWTTSEQVFAVDGHEYRREGGDASQSHQCIVRSALTCDYEVVEFFELAG